MIIGVPKEIKVREKGKQSNPKKERKEVFWENSSSFLCAIYTILEKEDKKSKYAKNKQRERKIRQNLKLQEEMEEKDKYA